MNIKKIIIFSLVFLMLLGVATILIFKIKPQMHKTFLFEQIIYKRGTK